MSLRSEVSTVACLIVTLVGGGSLLAEPAEQFAKADCSAANNIAECMQSGDCPSDLSQRCEEIVDEGCEEPRGVAYAECFENVSNCAGYALICWFPV
jgi:hypothetical protein